MAAATIYSDFGAPQNKVFSLFPLFPHLSHFSHVQLFVTLWTVARKAPLSMGFSRQEYWSGLQFPPPEDLLDAGIEPGYPALQAESLLSEIPGKPILNLLVRKPVMELGQ